MIRRGTVPAIRVSNAAFVWRMALLVAITAVMLIVDRSLAGAESRENLARAAALYGQGMSLLGAGEAHEASDRLASALAMQRGNAQYARALARATLADDRPAQAERILLRLVANNGSDGAANLLLAELTQRSNRFVEAKSFYHRAVYGSWGSDSIPQRARARFALVELLAQQHDSAELLAELLPLEAEFADSAAIRRQLAGLFVRGGAPQRGARIYRELLRANSRDTTAYVGLGAAAIEMGSYQSARANFAEALRLDNHDTTVAARLRLSDSLVAMNPLDRSIGGRERFVRSRGLAEQTLLAVAPCAAIDSVARELSDSLQTALLRRRRARDEGVDGERLLQLAGSAWFYRPLSCAPRAAGGALAVLHAQLRQ